MLVREPDAIPGWQLKPGNEERVLKQPMELYDEVCPWIGDRFWKAVTVGIGKLESEWAEMEKTYDGDNRDEVPKLEEVIKPFVTKKRNAPSLVRGKASKLPEENNERTEESNQPAPDRANA